MSRLKNLDIFFMFVMNCDKKAVLKIHLSTSSFLTLFASSFVKFIITSYAIYIWFDSI